MRSLLWKKTKGCSLEKEHSLMEIAEAKEAAEKSDRLKSAFLANMSHEIRTSQFYRRLQLIPKAENEEMQHQYINVVNK